MNTFELLIFPIVITIHNVEEAFWLPNWSKKSHNIRTKEVDDFEFRFAVVIITLLAYMITWGNLATYNSKIFSLMYVGFVGSMLINAIFPHLLVTLITRKYMPGVLTGVIINIPSLFFIINRVYTSGLLTLKEILISTVSMSIILLMLLPILFKIGRSLDTSSIRSS